MFKGASNMRMRRCSLPLSGKHHTAHFVKLNNTLFVNYDLIQTLPMPLYCRQMVLIIADNAARR
jgi:hypothetical protein